jgi:hypothetical protein
VYSDECQLTFRRNISTLSSGSKNKLSKKPAWKQVNLVGGFLLNLFFRPWRWRWYVPPKRRLTLNGLHGVISQKMVLFITTGVKTSNPILFTCSDESSLLIICYVSYLVFGLSEPRSQDAESISYRRTFNTRSQSIRLQKIVKMLVCFSVISRWHEVTRGDLKLPGHKPHKLSSAQNHHSAISCTDKLDDCIRKVPGLNLRQHIDFLNVSWFFSDLPVHHRVLPYPSQFLLRIHPIILRYIISVSYNCVVK